jgi:hypothetical protein
MTKLTMKFHSAVAAVSEGNSGSRYEESVLVVLRVTILLLVPGTVLVPIVLPVVHGTAFLGC